MATKKYPKTKAISYQSLLQISKAFVSQSKFPVGSILVLDAPSLEGLFQMMLVTLYSVFVVTKGLVTGSEVTKGSALL